VDEVKSIMVDNIEQACPGLLPIARPRCR